MVYLIAGLSGVGKSCLCKAAAKKLAGVSHIDMDTLINERLKDGNHWSDFFNACKKEIERIEKENTNSNCIVLVDLGAGFFKDLNSFQFLENKKNVIIIVDEIDAIFERVKLRPNGYWRCKTKEDYRNELTEPWQNLFSKSEKFNMSGYSEECVKQMFIDFLKTYQPRIEDNFNP